MPEENIDNQVFEEVGTDDFDSLIKNIPELAAAQEYGVDVHMLIANVKRSIAERIERHQIALDTFDELRGAKLL